MVNLPINLDFSKFSSFFAGLKGRVSPAMATKVSPFAITGIRGAAWQARGGTRSFCGHVVSALADGQ
jgi:hypothetical protein